MVESVFFPPEEYEQRRRRLRASMAENDLDGCLISAPENIYYLCGLSHHGFFAYHALIVPADGSMVLIARAMEQSTVEALAKHTRFVGYGDGEDPAVVTAETVSEMGLAGGRFGIEKESLFLPPRIVEALERRLSQPAPDVSGLVNRLRWIQSPGELAYTRRAARVTDAMMEAAMAVAAPGVNEQEIAAATLRAMPLAGGEVPGFAPFIRSTPTLHQEHRTWEDRALEEGDVLFLELAGCVRNYHAPSGRLLYVGSAPPAASKMAAVCLDAFAAAAETMRPGARAREVYAAWQGEVDAAGLSHYRRHHCGYLVGIGFPPSWVGGARVTGLRHDSDLILQQGMVFHLMSWLMGAGSADFFVSDTAAVTPNGRELLTGAPRQFRVIL